MSLSSSIAYKTGLIKILIISVLTKHYKEGVFICPQIETMLKDEEFETKLNNLEKSACSSLESVCNNFLGNKNS